MGLRQASIVLAVTLMLSCVSAVPVGTRRVVPPMTNIHGKPVKYIHTLDDGQHTHTMVLDRVPDNMDSPFSPVDQPSPIPEEDDFVINITHINATTKKWTEGNFEIHIFQVGQGDSQLIIFPSGFTMLIDICEKAFNSRKGAELVAAKVKAILGHNHINVGSPSHWHLDHLGYAGYGGFWYLIEKDVLVFDKIVDRDGGVWLGDGALGGEVNGVCDLSEIEWHNAGTIGGTAENWICYATNKANKKIYNIRETAKMKSTTQVSPPDRNAVVTVLLVDAKGAMQEDGITPVSGDNVDQLPPPSENDFCIGFLIQFGDFTYVTAGDTDGQYETSSFGYTYNDVESVLAGIVVELTGPIDVLHANHHGSSHSSNQDFVNALHPQASFVSCGYDNAHGHPAQASLDRLLDVGDVFLPNVCDPSRAYGKSYIMDGDIVLSSTTGKTFQIGPKQYTSKKHTLE